MCPDIITFWSYLTETSTRSVISLAKNYWRFNGWTVKVHLLYLASKWDLNWDCFVKLLLSRSRNNFHASPISEHESNKRTTATELSCQPIHLHDNWENTSSKDCMMWLKAQTDVAYNSATVLESNHGVLYCCSGTSALVAQMYFCFFEHRSSNLTTSINPEIYDTNWQCSTSRSSSTMQQKCSTRS